MAWTVTVAKPAQRQVAKFPAKDQQKIGAAVRSMADDAFLATCSNWKAKGIAGAGASAAIAFSSPSIAPQK